MPTAVQILPNALPLDHPSGSRPSNSGELIYTRGLLQALAARPGFKITVLAHRAVTPGEEGALSSLHWELHGWIPQGHVKALLSRLPSDAWRLGNRTMRSNLNRLSEEEPWDWVILDQAASGWALHHLPGRHGRPRVAYLAHNHEATVRRQVAEERGGSALFKAALGWDAAKYGRMERAICRRADLISAITPRDRAVFQNKFPDTPVICLPAMTVPPPVRPKPITKAPHARSSSPGPSNGWPSGATSRLSSRPPTLRSAITTSASPVAGKASPDYFAALGRKYPWARFHANVPSIDPFLADARMGLIPEALGGGFKLKALDYIFRGLPLAALEPALSGLPIDPQRDAVTATDPAKLAEQVAARIDDPAFLNAAASRALEACRDAFRWEDRGEALALALETHAAPA